MSVKRFIVFANEGFKDILGVLLDSLEAFSSGTVHVVAVNFKLSKEYPKFIVDEVTWPTDWAEDVGTYRMNYIVENQISNAVLLDADCVANWNCDQLLDILDDAQDVRSLAPIGICGGFFWKEELHFLVGPYFRYINSTPMVISPKSLAWFTEVWPSWPELDSLFRRLHSDHRIDDECAFNYLRAMAGERHYLSCCAPDRHRFKRYLEDAKYDDDALYRHVDVTWQFFHGEKNPVKAVEMFRVIQERGRDFLFKNPYRNKRPLVYCAPLWKS